MVKELKAWVLALRLKTLSASVVPIFVASALVKMEKGIESFSFSVFFFSLLASSLIQMGTNLINDALDFKQGRDTRHRIGPLRASSSGILKAKAVLRGGFFCFFLAFLFGIPLVFKGGWVIVCIGIFSLLFGYLYTGGGKWSLASLGLSEFFVLLFFGFFSVGGVYYLHTLHLSFEALLTGLQMGSLCTVLLVINNLRDIKEDEITQKKTLAVRFGMKFSRFEILFLFFLSFFLNLFWLLKMKFILSFLPFLSLPLGISLMIRIFKNPPSQKYNTYLAQASFLYVFFGFLLSVGFLIS